MNSKQLNSILAELRKPFHPSDIFWKPGSVNSDGTKALALAYATLRTYQNRLDEVCGQGWSVTYTPWDDKIICHLTIHGITRSGIGEPDSREKRSEIAGTAAEAQAFKRACSAFGLGRYLYHLPTVWLAYDAGAKQFTAQAKSKLEGIVVQHYQRMSHPQADEDESPHASQDNEGEAAADEELHTSLRQQFTQLGTELYGDSWAEVCRHNIERISQSQASDPDELTAEHLQQLIAGLQQLKRKRRTARSGKKQAAKMSDNP